MVVHRIVRSGDSEVARHNLWQTPRFGSSALLAVLVDDTPLCLVSSGWAPCCRLGVGEMLARRKGSHNGGKVMILHPRSKQTLMPIFTCRVQNACRIPVASEHHRWLV